MQHALSMQIVENFPLNILNQDMTKQNLFAYAAQVLLVVTPGSLEPFVGTAETCSPFDLRRIVGTSASE
jgi:hypothetical protein